MTNSECHCPHCETYIEQVFEIIDADYSATAFNCPHCNKRIQATAEITFRVEMVEEEDEQDE